MKNLKKCGLFSLAMMFFITQTTLPNQSGQNTNHSLSSYISAMASSVASWMYNNQKKTVALISALASTLG